MKKWLLAVAAVFLLFPGAVMAHSHLETSTPTDGETVSEPLDEIVLTFSAGIEEGSTMRLSGKEGDVEFANVTVEGDTMTGTLGEALPDGSYTVVYNVISEDGHPIDGDTTFETAAGIAADDVETEEEPPADEQSGTPVEDESTEDDDTATEDATAQEQAATDGEEESGNGMMTGILALVALLLIAVIFFSLRRKR